jgi:predicted lipid-binding transport protein (Tim44 family)
MNLLCKLGGAALGALGKNSSEDAGLRLFGDDALDAAALASAEAGAEPAVGAVPMWQQAQTQLAQLQKADPNFTEVTFLAQAAKTYTAAVQAEAAGLTQGVEAALTPACAQRLKQRADARRAAGQSRIVAGLQIDSSRVFRVGVDAVHQSITVRFTGSATRWTRDDVTGVPVEGSPQNASFAEFATFLRPAGSMTPARSQAGTAAQCPSCGAPLGDGASSCAFCGASLSAGSAWLLDKISASAYT